ncbi:MAG: ABC transporter, partial [Sphingomonas sp.]|nr:ABC transporter [Sphingomonas sp.]
MTDSTADASKPGRRLGSLAMVWHYAIRYPLQLCIALLALLTSSGATLSIPLALKSLIDRGLSHGADMTHVNAVFYQLFAVVAVLGVATAIRFYFVSWLGERTVADVRIAVQQNLLRLTPRWFEENRPSEIASRLTSDTTQIEMAVGTTVSVALRNVITGIGGTVMMFTLAPKYAGMILLGIPIVLAPILLLGRRLRATSRTSQDRIADIGAIAVEVFSAMKVVQAFGQEKRESQRFTDIVARGFTAAKRRILLRAILTALFITLIFGAVTLLLWGSAADVAAGRMSPGTLSAFIAISVLTTGAFGALSDVYGDLLRAAGAAERL